MIRRQRKLNLATATTSRIPSNSGNRAKENLPTTFIAAPSSNGYFHVDTSNTNNGSSSRRRRRLKSHEKCPLIQLWIAFIVAYCFCISYCTLSVLTRAKQKLQTPILPSMNNNFTIIFPPQLFRLPSPRKRAVYERRHLFTDDDEHDFGGLELRFPSYTGSAPQEFGRVVYRDKHEDAGYEELWDATDDDGYMESYYAFDDDEKRNPLVMYDDPDIHLKKKCRRTNWHRQLPITCNSMHEFDFQSHVGMGDTKYLGKGYYRTVFLTSTPHTDPLVVKMLNSHYDFTYEDFEYMRMDAIVNEKLNGNPEIVHSYSFCGNSIIGEAMALGDLLKIAVPSAKSRKLPKVNNENKLMVHNTLSGTQKLEWSLQMAEAVLLLHSFPGGVIVHDDIYLNQFLLTEKGKVKLNDFNRAEIMLWNEKDQEYCKYRNDPGGGNWRAPEEYHDNPLDEKIDIWSLGNNMYGLLTGDKPFYMLSQEKLKEAVMHGKTAFIDSRFQKRSFAESKLAEIIPLCWRYDPSQRIDIFQLVDLLRNAVEENKAHQK